MAFDNPTRNRLQRLVSECRDLLTREFDAQLKELYGIYADEDRVLDLEKLATLDDEKLRVASLLRERINHLASGGGGTTAAIGEAVKRVLREQAFTVLNRFAALRMAEERGIIVESIGGGLNSKGFKMYSEVAHSGLGSAYERYRVFLGCMFDELATDLGVLFDRRSPYGLLFPRENVLLEMFGLLNAPEMKPLWKEDETIGWIYQYFNDPAERKKMRDESPAPRNSRELAVRNQFFTPRYVVEFLADNTLGRIWYEMCGGATSLREKCHYLVRRPNEVFLKPDEAAPAQTRQDNLSQEELLKWHVFIPHCPIKDPRTILMLDPACGSMHFGLYAFDLYEIIYDEAWELEGVNGAPSLARQAEMKSLRATFATKEEFLRQVPRLIIEHNLHGIDIDPRCAQIAGLSLWLRAQKSWQRLGLKPAERPRITRSNIVCAEPMPGEKELLREFVEKEFPAAERGVFLLLLETIFDKMQLAGEAGSLLNIEEEIKTAVETAREIWQKMQAGSAEFFSTGEMNAVSKQSELPATADLRLLTSDFFERVEERIYAALRDYAEQAENGGGFQRRLFAEDAARGFAFIDVCRKRYDVAVMNPPFGEASIGSREYLYESLPEASRDLFAGFVTRFNNLLLSDGRLGVLSNRTAFFSDFLARWRVENFLGEVASLSAFADLGYGVLDAVVEAAAYVCSRRRTIGALFINVLGAENKADALQKQLLAIRSGSCATDTAIRDLRVFERLPDHRFIYQLHSFWVDKLNLDGENSIFTSRSGLTTGDDLRHLRLFFEIPAAQVGQRWKWLAKGGEFSRYRTDLHLLADWHSRDSFVRMRNPELYGKSGVTYTERTTSNLSARVLNEGGCFSVPGPGIIPNDPAHLQFLLAYINSFVAVYLVEALIGGGDFSMKGTAARHLEPGYMKHLPKVAISSIDARWFSDRVNELLQWLEKFVTDESDALFRRLPIQAAGSLRSAIDESSREMFRGFKHAYRVIEALENKITEILEIPQDRIRDTYSDTGWPWATREALPEGDHSIILSADPLSPRAGIPENDFGPTNNRFEMKLSHYLHSGVERYAAFRGVSPIAVCQLLEQQAISSPAAVVAHAEATIAYVFGSVFGRWDIRYATGEQAVSELPDPFAPLPVCPPGQLLNAQGLPARPEDVPEGYPLKNIPWAGILVDDESHKCDIITRIREVIEIIWTGSAGSPSAEAIEHEAGEILGVKSLRDYFRKPAGFFADHLKRYSKSRRQAPVYWPLATASGSYTLWIYYHRLTDQTLFQCVNDFVKPKITEVEGDLSRLTTTGADKPGARAEIERLTILRAELMEFRDELLRVAQLPYKPNLNDGVLITASPLWKLFRLPKWQKDLKACWTALENEEYEWAHLAYTLWPDRVKAVCKRDRSIAIAHGLESLCDVKAPEKKAKKKKKEQVEVEETQ